MVVVLLAVSLVVVGPVTGMVGGGSESAQRTEGRLQQATPTPANDTTRHEDPDEISQDGDLAELRRWLAGRMAVQLERCAVAIGRGSTDVCAFQDQYPDWLGKYVDVAEETGTDKDDEQAETFEEAAEETRTLADQTDEFQQTYREYRAAREAGNRTKARRLARELIRQGGEVNSTATELVEDYAAIERGSGVELAVAKDSVNRTVANVTRVVTEVETELFVATNLTAEIAPREISFLAPGTVTGRLVTENGSGVSNEPIRLEVGGRVLRTVTDETGEFSLAYRPTTIPVDATQITVRYVPRNASAYLGSSAAVQVSLTQVTPTVSVDVSPTEARFGDLVRISGAVAADGVPAPGVPLAVTVDGRSVGTVRTDGEGAFTVTAAIGAFDGPGDVSVRAALPLEDRALAAAAGESRLTVRSTETALAISLDADGPREVTVAGTLRTTDGDPVPGQPVRLRINGTPVEAGRTDADGRFRTGVTVPPSLLEEDGNTSVQVVAAFDGAGTNLEGSDDRAVVVLPAAAGGPPGEGTGGLLERIEAILSDPIVTGVGALGVLLLLGLLYLGWRRSPFGGPTAGDDGPPAAPGREAGTRPAPAAEDTTVERRPLEMARERLPADADGAVLLAYAAVRGSLTRSADTPRGRAATHWEFLAACRADGLDAAAIDGLTRLTEAYEQAAYAPASLSTARAESVLDSVEGLVG